MAFTQNQIGVYPISTSSSKAYAEFGGMSGYALTASFATVTGLSSTTLQDFTFASNALTYTGVDTKPFYFTVLMQYDMATSSYSEFRLAINGSVFTTTTPGAVNFNENTSVTAPFIATLSTSDEVTLQARYTLGSGVIVNVRIMAKE